MTAPEPTDTPLDEAVGSAETPEGSAATPEGLRMDVVAEGEVTALLPAGVGDLALLIDAGSRATRRRAAGARTWRSGRPGSPARRRSSCTSARCPPWSQPSLRSRCG